MGGNLAGISLVARPHLFVSYASEALFLMKTMADNRSVPQRNVFEVFGTDGAAPSISLAALDSESARNWFQPVPSYVADLVSLCLLCRLLQPKVVFEIGTLRGFTAAQMAMNTPAESVIYTLDLPPRGKPSLTTTPTDDVHIRMANEGLGYCFDNTEAAAKIRPLLGDSATFDFSPFRGSVDLFFIDGAHSYEFVKSDTENALPCCHPGSVVVWHDFGRAGVNGVSRRVLEIARSRKVYSIPGGSLAYMPVQ